MKASRQSRVGMIASVLLMAAPLGMHAAAQIPQFKLENPGVGDRDYHDPAGGMGRSIALDADTLIVGSFGSARVYARDGMGGWRFEAQLRPGDASGGALDFGLAVSVSGDTAIVGARHENYSGDNLGAAYVFVRTDGVWNRQAKLLAAGGVLSDGFGVSVSISGETALVGALDDGAGGTNAGAAYVFVRSDGVWSQQAKMTAMDPAAGDEFGKSVAIDGETILIGAPYDDDAGDNSGSAYVFTRSGGGWRQQAKLTAADASTLDAFGFSVAISGGTALIGVIGDNAGAIDTGSAYVYMVSGEVWGQQGKLTANDAAAGDEFGNSVSIDGDTATIGAHRDDDRGSNSGSAYSFTRLGDVWSQKAKLTGADSVAGDSFGESIATSGEAVAVGAPSHDAAWRDAGAAYAFPHTGEIWGQAIKIIPVLLASHYSAAHSSFGASVAIHADTVLVGTPEDDTKENNSGVAHVFTRAGNVWTHQARLVPNDLATGDKFGWSVALWGDTAMMTSSADGSVYVFTRANGLWSQRAKLGQSGLAVALEGETAVVGGGNAAYVFGRTGETWGQKARLTASDAATAGQFGVSVAISGDAILVGAQLGDGGEFKSGSAYIFMRAGSGWSQQAKLIADDAAPNDLFGAAVGIDGDTAVVGAPADDDAGGYSGSAYVFTRADGVWSQTAKLTAADAFAGDSFGRSVAIAGDRIVVGMPGDDDGGIEAGAAYVFTRVDGVWSQQYKLKAADAGAGDNFGWSFALDGERGVAGSPFNNGPEADSGAAYVFELGPAVPRNAAQLWRGYQ